MPNDGTQFKSVLKIPRVVFDEITYKRLGFKKETENSSKLSLQSKIDKIDEGRYRVSLRANASSEDEYTITIQITGFCEVDESDPNKGILLEENAVAILFPYIRAELSLITAQPEMEPIVLPVVNISAMLKESKSAHKEDRLPEK